VNVIPFTRKNSIKTPVFTGVFFVRSKKHSGYG